MNIVNDFFKFDQKFGFEKNDLVLIGFTSAMRDKLPWMPDIFNNNVLEVDELENSYHFNFLPF